MVACLRVVDVLLASAFAEVFGEPLAQDGVTREVFLAFLVGDRIGYVATLVKAPHLAGPCVDTDERDLGSRIVGELWNRLVLIEECYLNHGTFLCGVFREKENEELIIAEESFLS